MNLKKLAIIGAVALVVFGCVIAAGCTSNTTGTDSSTPWTGAWSAEYTYDDGTVSPAIMYILPNGKETWMTLESNKLSPKIRDFYPGTWVKTGEKDGKVSLTITNTSDNAVYNYTYDKAKGTLTSEKSKTVYTRTEPIVGIWSGTSSDRTGNGNLTIMLRPEGTGISIISFNDGTANIYKSTWKKNADGTITLAHSNGNDRTYTVAADGKTMKSDDNRTLSKQFMDTSLLSALPGTWINTEKNYNIILNGDGTGMYTGDSNIAHFTWKKAGNWKTAVTYLDGKTEDGKDIKGKVYTWTYDPEKKEITDGDGHKFVRTASSGNGITFVNTSSESNSPWVGTWVTKSKDENGVESDAVKYLKADGTEFQMELNNDSIGIQMNEFYTGTWKKIDDSTFKIIDNPTKEEYEFTYNKANDTIKSKKTNNVYNRTESIVGIWSGTSSDKTGNGNSTMLIKPNGTGLANISHDKDGTVDIYKLTWKKNTNGTFTLAIVDGHNRTYTVAADGKTMKSDDNRTFTKKFLDSSFLVETTGFWYNKEDNHIVSFNADGTGFFNDSKSGIAHFTWKYGDNGTTVKVTYIDGKTHTDEDIKGKVYTWTYNPEKKEFTDGDGCKFIRTTESVKDKVTYH